MKLNFHINYHTVPGELIAINYCLNDKTKNRLFLSSSDSCNWVGSIDIKETGRTSIKYNYLVTNANGDVKRNEWETSPHSFTTSLPNCTLYDSWRDISELAPLYSSAFTDCLFQRTQSSIDNNSSVVLTVLASQIQPNEHLAIVGAQDWLGGWNTDKAIKMTETSPGVWQVGVASQPTPNKIEFKFVILKDNCNGCEWEPGDNHFLDIPEARCDEVIAIECGEVKFKDWLPRIAGTVIPVFSLRSEKGFGIGDFGDLKKMIDWIAATGQHVLQLLPINDTTITHTWTDSYPYNSISIYALHPQYCDLNQLPPIKDNGKREHYERLQKELNGLPSIDYEAVNKVKIEYLHEIFNQIRANVVRRATFKKFADSNEYWLKPYAQYCANRDKYGTGDYTKWPKEADHCDNPSIDFWYFVQYILDQQLTEAHQYALKKRVILKGDIPIGVNHNGVDTWVEPQYFNLSSQAGAPPDAFSKDGQNWGFPTYNWDVMALDGYKWWQQRFSKMSKYFDAYRIDHVLGFFRIWDIPEDSVTGLLGQFSPALGMSKEEIESYGIRFDEEAFCNPVITNDILNDVFGDLADIAKNKYFTPIDNGKYALKGKYLTQRAVETSIKDDDEQSTGLKNGLYAIISNVLFVRDRKNQSLFHPRIALYDAPQFKYLDNKHKEALHKIHEEYFYRRHNSFWREEAMRKLPILTQCTRMLSCAEDLGMVPDCVPSAMSDLKILTLEIQQMPKKFGVEFSNLVENPYFSVSTISTHDMATLRQWWDEDPDRSQRYYNNVMHHDGEPTHPLTGIDAKEIVEAHLNSPSIMCLLSLQDWLSTDEQIRSAKFTDERINVPAHPRHYWRWRMHITIEDLIKNSNFNNSIMTMITESGRFQ